MRFSYESKYSQMISKLFDCILLSIFWIFSSLPVITIGAASTAMLFTAEKVIRCADGKLWQTYWKTFVREFRQATVLWLIRLVVYAVLAFGLYILYYMTQEGYSVPRIAALLALIAGVLFSAWSQYWMPYLARFTDTIPVILKNTMLIMLTNFWADLILLALLAVYLVLLGYGVLNMPPLLLFLPGVHCYLSSAFSGAVLKKYAPPEPEN